ncbi:MAG: hypothetical protein NVS2B16_08400 [Chloroflexota bacterium]
MTIDTGESESAIAGTMFSIAGGDVTLPDAVEEVLEVEGVAPSDNRTRRRCATVWLFGPDGDPRSVELNDIPDLVSRDENFVWVDLSGYGVPDLQEVGRLLHLHPVMLHTALSSWQQPELAVRGDAFLVSVTVARLDPDALRVRAGELDLFVGNNYLVSAHKLPLPFIDKVLARAQHNPELLLRDGAYMLYIVLDEVLEHYEDLNRHVESEIEAMEERALRDTSDHFLEELLRFKRYAFTLGHLADQHREVFAAFLRPDFAWVSGDEVEIYFRDLQGRLARLLSALQSAREAINGAFEIYVSHMAHRTNQVIKVLTMVSTVLLPTTVIIALFGTNIATSLHAVPVNTPMGLLVMLVAIVTVCSTILIAFHRKGWV